MLCLLSLEQDLAHYGINSPTRSQRGGGRGGSASQPTQSPFRSRLHVKAGRFFASSGAADSASSGPTLLSKTWTFQIAFQPCCLLTSVFRASPQAASCPPLAASPLRDSSILTQRCGDRCTAHNAPNTSAGPYGAGTM